MQFEELGLSDELLRALKDTGFEEPTEIQEKSIPAIMEGKDVIAGSKTGSGKTLAFGAGILRNARKGEGIQALVLTPTRELAEQICKNLRIFSKYKPLNIVPIYGGLAINPQIDDLRTADVVVGTPGRILDHMERNTIRLDQVNTLVLDEADRMLDMGFIEDVERIIRECGKERQTLFFSATIMQEVADLARRYMHDPVKISGEAQVDPSQLQQAYYDVADNRKFSLLVHLLKHEKEGLVMVFCNSRSNTDFVATNLQLNDIEAEAIHGGFTQAKRNKIMSKFHSGKMYVLVCTDVAARGLDIQGVSHVYNYDIPKDSKQYIHRVGRTARAGKEGKAVNILTQRDYDNFDRVLREYRLTIEKIPVPHMERPRIRIPERRERSEGRSFRGRGGEGRRERRDGPPREMAKRSTTDRAPRFGTA